MFSTSVKIQLLLGLLLAAILFGPRGQKNDPLPTVDEKYTPRSEPSAWLTKPIESFQLNFDRDPWRAAKQAARDRNDVPAIAQANARLSADAINRSAVVLRRWLSRPDPETHLFPTSVELDGQVWVYGDTGADLYPHLAIATQLLAPDQFGIILDVLKGERELGKDLPTTIDLTTNQEVPMDRDDAIFGAAEYVKDGLMPMTERLGRGPWLERAREITDVILADANTPTPNQGKIPANSTEVNGDMLQVLLRLYWATGEQRYFDMADRISLTYLEDVIPHTTYLPPNQWDFMTKEPIGRRRLRLSDHGNEIISGLIEWHLTESALGRPEAQTHRVIIRRMLDRILATGRTPDGLWLRVIEIPSGKVEQPGVTDTWGYIFQAFLAQAAVERTYAGGDITVAQRYEDAARLALHSLHSYRDYAWEGGGKMDGYADSMESAVYVLNVVNENDGVDWLDDQMGSLFRFQAADGSVLERDLDGNFIRSAMIYAASLDQGARLEPWGPEARLGAAVDGNCVVFSLQSDEGWSGRVIIDSPRFRENLGLPIDYPRLNKWPEWFVAEPGRSYEVSGVFGPRTLTAGDLTAGILVDLASGADTNGRICPAR